MEVRELKTRIRVRKARGSDRAAVFRFCEKTWSWGDYVPKVWDKWLKERNGGVFAATINGVPVGISHLSVDKPGEVWLSAARTDPNYRRMGVATAITRKCLEYAKKKGAKVARLVTGSNNKAAQAVVEKLGFRQIAEFVEMVAENVTEERSKKSRFVKKDRTKEIWNYLQRSETYGKAAGLYTVLFHWFALDKEALKRFVEGEKAIVHENEKGELNGLTLIDNATARAWHENTIQTCYVDGDNNAVLDMIRFLKSHCYDLGIQKIYGFTPNHKPITTALEKLGFEPPDSVDIIYEKKLS
jgi:ribosomal protein S18 acetylase RimI-like enzyme